MTPRETRSRYAKALSALTRALTAPLRSRHNRQRDVQRQQKSGGNASGSHPHAAGKPGQQFPPEAVQRGNITLQGRGAIEPQLNASEAEVMSFLEDMAPDLDTSPRPAPVGASGVQLLVNPYASEVLFGTLTSEQAAEQMTGEIEALIG